MTSCTKEKNRHKNVQTSNVFAMGSESYTSKLASCFKQFHDLLVPLSMLFPCFKYVLSNQHISNMQLTREVEKYQFWWLERNLKRIDQKLLAKYFH